MRLHEVERLLAPIDAPRFAQLEGSLEIDDMVAQRGDVGLAAILFPKQPFVDLGLRAGIVRQQGPVPSKVANDGIGLREAAAIGDSTAGP